MKKTLPVYDDMMSPFDQNRPQETFSIKNDLPKLLNCFDNIIKPDFILVMDLRDPSGRIAYEKNHSLESTKGEVNSDLIMKSLTNDNMVKLLEIDRLSIEFLSKSYRKPYQLLMNVGIPVELSKGECLYLMRTSMVVSADKNNIPHHILAYFKDITAISGKKKSISYSFSSYNNDDSYINELKANFDQFMATNLLLTKQEKTILESVKKGETSFEISEKLFISKATVDTHRQNIIKKLKVNNTSAAVAKASELGIIN